MTTRIVAIAAGAVAVLALGGSVLASAIDSDGSGRSWGRAGWMMGGPSAMGGPSMMGGYGPAMGMMETGGYGPLGRARPVRSLDAARDRAAAYARGAGLRVGEVMEFSNGFYAELVDREGRGAAEVLIDPDTGAVWPEYGPAMMWNTRYGYGSLMSWSGQRGRRVSPGARRVSPAEARRIADRWLARAGSKERAGRVEEFPGYYTLHTVRDGRIVGMLSVRAATGSVWYHSWHGTFERISG